MLLDAAGEPRWVAADVAKVLGYSTAKDMTRNLDADEKGGQNVPTPGGSQMMTVITESGLYAAVLKSRRPEAVEFRRWVTQEVLPSIRRHGGYLTADTIEEALTDPDTIIRLATRLKEERNLNRRLAIALNHTAPKADAYDTFISADGTYSIGNVAKMLGLSQNKLFDELRNAGILIAKGAMRNTPYQRYMHHFTVRAYEYGRHDGTRGSSYTTRVQPSGIDFIRRKLNHRNQAAGGDAA
ncbi:MAG: phage antirepressor KilAC domain-containing protein [Corynebacterium sphenisci]|nr:phage antirepressor KilAC domain-containing protein [Corynebacterium sphenisci]MDO5730777.1 phage antirepressor KilAC domain-containing protein [Corynebacterium sphenisci]